MTDWTRANDAPVNPVSDAIEEQDAERLAKLEAALAEWAEARKSVRSYADETWCRLSAAESALERLFRKGGAE